MKYWLLILICFIPPIFAQNLALDAYNLYPKVKLETNKGVIIVELDRVKAPLTVDNFLSYVVAGEYNDTIFHRIVEGFVVQGGGYDTELNLKETNGDIVNESGNGLKNEEGTIAMARENKPHSANRQFFFNVGENTNLNPGKNWGYTVFGLIIEGEEIVTKMAQVKTDFHEELGWEDVPIEPVILKKATLLPVAQ